jgi:hypothetical protein
MARSEFHFGPLLFLDRKPELSSVLWLGLSHIFAVDDEPMLYIVIETKLGTDHDVTTVAVAKEALRKLSRGEGRSPRNTGRPLKLLGNLWLPGLESTYMVKAPDFVGVP